MIQIIRKKNKLVAIGLLFILCIIFFWQFLLKGLLPIPSDTIVGLYYPFRDIYAKTNPNGLPYKNFLVTDPVRQTYPWRDLSISQLKLGNLPLWNPYNFAGAPLLANLQSAVFYPFNILFFILPFSLSWSILILIEPLLAGVFLFLYLDNLKLRKEASFLGAVAFSFSGFFIAWLEWGTILNAALWLPLILLSVDKIFQKSEGKNQKSKPVWPVIFVLALSFSFFAGHLQTFFYLSLLSFFYFLARFVQHGKNLKMLGLFIILTSLFLILTLVQWLPTLQFILLSARNVDLPGYTSAGWFVPWQNLVQFVAPDFFGNPATLNYFGIWNYGEFIGYIGIFPLIIALFALFFRRDKKTLFFGTVFFVSLILALPTIFAKIPFKFNFPFISTAQPTRLMFLIDFSLSVLAAFGFDYFISLKNKKAVLYILGAICLLFIGLWGFVLVFHGSLITPENLRVAKQNLILPTILFVIVSALLLVQLLFFEKYFKNKGLYIILISCLLILVTVFDLFRFGWKFEPFTNKDYLYPSSSVISYLQNQNPKEPFRVMSTDSRILPPNFSIMFKIQTLDGYDPLYLQRYGELMAAVGRQAPNINPPFGFNRIITPQNYLSAVISFMNVKYILSLEGIKNTNLSQVFTDGTIRVYENKLALPRAFFVPDTLIVKSNQDAIDAMFAVNYALNSRSVVENVSPADKNDLQSRWSQGELQFTEYGNNKIIIKTQNQGKGFLVLTDSYYPTWHATIDGKPTKIYLTDYNFRGIIVPKGEHTIEFYDTLF